MPAKKVEKKEEEAPKKRSRPVVEEVVEEVEETPVVETTPEPEAEVVETVIEETPSGKVSVEPDFSNLSSTVETPETTEAPAEETTTTEVVEEVSDTEAQSSNEPAKEEKTQTEGKGMGFKTILFITLISALVAAFVSGGVYVYLSGVNSLDLGSKEETQEEVQESTAPSPTPSPTPEPEEEVDLSEFSVQVLNGSGQIGAAGKGSDSVESVGLTVDDTGNADNYDYEETVVQVKSTVPSSVVDKVIQALEDDGYSVEEGDELKSSDEFDMIVIVGSK